MEKRFSSMGSAATNKGSRRVGGSCRCAGQPRLAHLPGVHKTTRRGMPCARGSGPPKATNGSSTLPLAWKTGSFGASESLRGVRWMRTPELLSSGTGRLGPGGTASEDGKLAYNILNSSVSIYQISVSDHGQKLGPTFQLPLPEGGSYTSPSLSRDGRWMAYDTSNPASPTPSC